MKKLGFFGKLFYIINIFFGLLLLFSYFVPMIPPGTIPFIATLSLLMPVLMIINVIFAILWIMKLNIRFTFSLLILVLGINHIDSFFRWSNSEFVGSEDVKVMTFNVRMFNTFGWIKHANISEDIYDLVKSENPDVVAFQEYHEMKNFDIGDYEYDYFYYPGKKKYWGQAMFSRHPIIANGRVDFPSKSNSAVFIDVDVNGTKIRVYSVHLETLSLNTNDLDIDKAFDVTDSSKSIGQNITSIASKIDKGFGRHGEQADILREHINSSPYPVIVMGDFNSSAFSYEYREIRGDLIDAFEVG